MTNKAILHIQKYELKYCLTSVCKIQVFKWGII